MRAMREYPLSANKKGVRSFLGMVGYYRKFIKNFADLAMPLTEMTKKAKPTRVQWTDNSTQAFQALKDALVTAPILATSQFDLPFILQTDASENALGAVLSQNIGENEHPIAFISRKLLPREQNKIIQQLKRNVWQ